MKIDINALDGERKAIVALAKANLAKAKEAGEEFTDEQQAEFDGHMTKAEELQGQIEAAEASAANQLAASNRLAAVTAWDKQPQKRITALVDPNPGPIQTRNPDPEPAGEFATLGEMLVSVAAAADPSRARDPRLNYQASTGLNEAVPSAGGFLVGTDITTELLQRAYNNTVLLNGGPGFSGARRIPISTAANGMKINGLNETSRADGSRWGGVRAYWLEEGGSKTASKPEFKQISLELKKLIGLCYATDELLQDAAALEAVISQAFADEFSFKIQEAMYNGTGGGTPLGILNAPCLVSVGKENGQAAGTIVKKNIDKMWARMYPRSVANSVWLINQNVYPALFDLTQAVGTGGTPVYLPPGGMSQSPYGTLLGRPVVPIEQCQTLGTKGDIAFCDYSQYLFADKGGIQSASSIHVNFTYDETVFRFVYRCDGRPAWNAKLTPYKGGAGAATSPFIVLESR